LCIKRQRMGRDGKAVPQSGAKFRIFHRELRNE
jgi:hypothetical protein